MSRVICSGFIDEKLGSTTGPHRAAALGEGRLTFRIFDDFAVRQLCPDGGLCGISGASYGLIGSREDLLGAQLSDQQMEIVWAEGLRKEPVRS